MVFVAATSCSLTQQPFIQEPYNIFTRRLGGGGPTLRRSRRRAGRTRRGAIIWPIIWRESWLVSGRWRPPRPSAASGAPRGGTVCCWVCRSPTPSRNRRRRPKPSPGRPASLTVPPGLFQTTWGAETEDAFCLPGGASVGAPGLWAGPFEGTAGVGRVSSYHGLCLETWPSSC